MKRYIGQNLRGELTVLKKADEREEKANELVKAVAKVLDTSDIDYIKAISEYANPLLVNGVAS